MFYTLVDSASLKNPTLLNGFKFRKVTVSHEPKSTSAKYHYNFLLEIQSRALENVISKFQKEMLSGWYSFFWNKSLLYIVFNSAKFKINLPDCWESKEYKAAQIFGKSQNISEEYLNFKKYFNPVT